MKYPKIETAEKTLENLLQASFTEAAQLRERIAQADEQIAQADAAMREAGTRSDLAAFQDAKRDRQNAADAREMCAGRLQEITEAPLISKADFDRTVAAIRAELTEAEGRARAELIRLSAEMSAVSAELDAAIARAEDVAERMQAELRRNADRKILPNGVIVGKPIPIPQSARDAVSWGRDAAQHFAANEGNR